jgi:hypothetical protein
MKLGFFKGISTGKLGVGELASGGGNDDPIGDALRADAVAYWKMDEENGTRQDSTANNRDLTETESVPGVTGKISDAANFTIAAGNGLKILNDTAFTSLGTEPFTFAFWAKIDDITENIDHTLIYRTVQSPSTRIDWYAFFNPNVGNFIILDAYDLNSEEYGFVISTTEISEGVWYFVLGYIDPVGELAGLRVNDVEVTEGFFSTPAAHGTYNDNCLSVGAEINFTSTQSAVFQTRGDIDEVGFWPRLLSAEEKDYLYNSGTGRTLYP